MRIESHPVLSFTKGRKVKFLFDGKTLEGYENEPIACALHDAGIRALSHTQSGRPRGFYCAIGNCSSCMMTVDGEPNIRVCVQELREGMDVRTQLGKGVLK